MNIYSLCFFVIGGVFLIPSLIMYIIYNNRKKKIEKYAHTTGVITSTAYNGFNYKNDMNPNVQIGVGNAVQGMTHRVYEYEINGTKYTNVDGVAVSLDIIKNDIGKNVDVYYDENNPNNSVITIPGKVDAFKLLTIIFFCISSFLLAFGLILLVLL